MPGSRPPAPTFPLAWWHARRESAAACLARYPDWKVGPDLVRLCDWHIARLECEHLSATGVDQDDGPGKVWRCDACGWLYRQEPIDPDVPFVVRLVPA